VRRFRAASDLDRALARNVVLVSLFVAIAGVARLMQEMVIAWKFGAGAAVDAYYFVFAFLNWPVGVWSSVLVVLLVPTEARARRRSTAELTRFRSELLGLTLVTSCVVTVAAVVALGGLLQGGSFALSTHVREAAVAAVPVLAWLVPLGLPIGLLSTWILAAGRQTNTLVEATPAAVVIVFLLAAPEPTLGVLLWGTAAGFAMRLLVLGVLLGWRHEVPRPRLSFSAVAWNGFWRGGAAMVVGQVLLTITVLVDQVFAARLGDGAVATLAYANRIILMVQALTALVAQRASLPLLAESFADGGGQARRALPRWTLGMFVGGTSLAAAGWLLADPLVALLFERGAFSPADTARVSEVLVFGLVQLPFYLAGLVYVSAIAAQGHPALVGFAGVFGCVMKLTANWLFFPALELRGLQLATAVMYLSTFLFLHFASRPLAQAARRRSEGG
jgi:peptidoglycan biosynthesis protein MviN/MurJ (putative lipid II flippase)